MAEAFEYPPPRRRWIRWTIGVTAILLILGLPPLAAYGTTQNWFTQATGHVYSPDDLRVAQDASFSKGRTSGYRAGHEAGERDGYQRGVNQGRASGLAEGRQEG